MRLTSLLLLTLLAAPFTQAEERHYGCDPKTTQLPALIMVGERHDSEASQLIHTELIIGATRGEYPVATEIGSIFGMTGAMLPEEAIRTTQALGEDMSTSLLQGIESMVPRSLFFSYEMEAGIERPNRDTLPPLYALGSYGRESSLIGYAIYNVSVNPQVDEMVRELAGLMDMVIRKPFTNSEIQELLTLLDEKFPLELRQAVVHAQHRELVRLINEKYVAYFDSREVREWGVQSNWDTLTCGFWGAQCLSDSYMKSMKDFRDRDFCNNTLDMLCAMSGKHDQVFAIMGHAHMPGVTSCLESKTNQRIQIQSFMSHEQSRDELVKMTDVLSK